jgi:hypothetical protein
MPAHGANPFAARPDATPAPSDPTAPPTPPYGVGEVVFCRFCGSFPAAETTVRGHRGFIIVMSMEHLNGPFCRSCGLATFRKMTASTLKSGWWSFGSILLAPLTLLWNLIPYARIRRLAPPVPGSPVLPMQEGKPLTRRPVILWLLLPIVLTVLFTWAFTTDDEDGGSDTGSGPQVGQCVSDTGSPDKPKLKVVPCASTDPQPMKVMARLEDTADDAGCPTMANMAYTMKRGSDPLYTLCLLDPNQP